MLKFATFHLSSITSFSDKIQNFMFSLQVETFKLIINLLIEHYTIHYTTIDIYNPECMRICEYREFSSAKRFYFNRINELFRENKVKRNKINSTRTTYKMIL